MFEPFGPANEQPVFATENVEIAGEPRIVGNRSDFNNQRSKTRENHLKMKIRQGNKVFDTIGFNMADKYDMVNELRTGLKIAYYIEENTWNNKSYIQLKLQDISS